MYIIQCKNKMKLLDKVKGIVFISMAMLVFFPINVHAYLDPGSGSMILQVIGMLFIALSGFWFAFKTKIKAWFGRKKENNDDSK